MRDELLFYVSGLGKWEPEVEGFSNEPDVLKKQAEALLSLYKRMVHLRHGDTWYGHQLRNENLRLKRQIGIAEG